jgi:hypothetical protein
MYIHNFVPIIKYCCAGNNNDQVEVNPSQYRCKLSVTPTIYVCTFWKTALCNHI